MSNTENNLPPVQISGAAHKTYADAMRRWSGWPEARLTFGEPDPEVSPIGMTNQAERSFTINVDRLTLNPHRVISNVTPFRMRQEAVLTGVMLHEAAHARFSHWRPIREEDVPKFLHSDGTVPTEQTVALARLVEEARIEGLMHLNAEWLGCSGLTWTMRASAAHLLPMTTLSDDPDKQIMEIITSWVLRAGRVMATTSNIPQWVREFNILLRDALIQHCKRLPAQEYGGVVVLDKLKEMVLWGGQMPTPDNTNDDAVSAMFPDEDNTEPHTGPFMIDTARDILEILYPGQNGGSAPMPVGGCAACAIPAESDEQGDGEGSGGEQDGDAGEEAPEEQVLAGLKQDQLSDMEAKAERQEKAEQREQTSKAPPTPASGKPGGTVGGHGSGGVMGKGWRAPTKDERDIQRGAEKFLRSLVDPTEVSKVSLSESPAAMVDPTALATWKAAGEKGAPMFFKRTRRHVEPSTPVRVAVLVDVSSSMNVLQKPSALLSWALSAAALDLRNFAGRGAQVQSCLIHWGDTVDVVQANGAVLPGIREVPCLHGTSAMAAALEEVERQMPGFFDAPEHPEHRLLVQFTDWMLSSFRADEATDYCVRALQSGVNMLSVVPSSGTWYLQHTENKAIGAPGRSVTLPYNRSKPEQVWDVASSLMK